MMMLMIMAMIMLITSNSALNESSEVIVPAPAIKGNATGTIVPELSCSFGLKSSILRIISSANKKITIAPAIEND